MEYSYVIALEKAILSSFFYTPADYEKYIYSLNEEDFTNVIHKKIFLKIVDMLNNKLPIDDTTIALALKKDGLDYQSSIFEIIATSPIALSEYHINQLKENGLKHTLNMFYKEMSTLNESPDVYLSKMSKFIDDKSTKSLDFMPIYKCNEIKSKESEFYSTDWLPIPKRTVSIISAPGGSGKSFIVNQLSQRIINENKNLKAFLWLSEDPKELTSHRAGIIANKILDKTVPDNLYITDAPAPLLLDIKRGEILISSYYYKTRNRLKEYDFIVLDPLIAFFGGEENNNSHARQFMQLFTKWASEENKTIVFIHHSTKGTTQSRGASAFVDAVRCVYEVEKIKDKNDNEIETSKRIFKLTKDNYQAFKHFKEFKKELQIFPHTLNNSTSNRTPK